MLESEAFDDEDLLMRCVESEERPSDLPEIIDQVWECSYKTEIFGYLFTTPYGWTHSKEVMVTRTPEQWAHWQEQEATLFRLLDALSDANELPPTLIKDENNSYLDAIVGSDLEDELNEDGTLIESEDDGMFQEIVEICATALVGLKQFVEDDRVPYATAKQFIEQIKREIAAFLLMAMAEVSEMEDIEDTEG